MAVVIEREIFLPQRGSAVAFSADATRLLGDDGPGWLGAQTVAAAGLEALAALDIEAVALFCALTAGSDRANRVALLLSWDGTIDDPALDAVRGVLEAADPPWVPEGTRAIPERAFASLAWADGAAWHLWHATDGATAARHLALDESGEVEELLVVATDTDPSAYLPDARHGLAIEARRAEPDEAPLLELMKVAWALEITERIIDADGTVHDDELEFLTRTFPPRRLRALGLHDRAQCLRLRRIARSELRHLLPRPEKLSLMGLFFRVAEADKAVHDKEIDVLQVAATELGLAWEDVRAYVADLW